MEWHLEGELHGSHVSGRGDLDIGDDRLADAMIEVFEEDVVSPADHDRERVGVEFMPRIRHHLPRDAANVAALEHSPALNPIIW